MHPVKKTTCTSYENKDKNNTIFYWNGIFDPKGLTEQYGPTIEKLVSGNYQSLKLEKLLGHNVFSIRLTDSDRLLFTTIIVNDVPYLMVLDEVLNHDYAKSRFLKPSVLKHYLEIHGKALSAELMKTAFMEFHDIDQVLPPAKKPEQTTKYSRIDFNNHKFIQLDKEQLKTVTQETLPMIISGSPGSGKSCIALLMLANHIENAQKPHSALYITESEPLARNMQKAWETLPIAQNLEANTVQFKSYQQLVQSLVDETKHMTFVEKEDCIVWLKGYIKDAKKSSITLEGKALSARLSTQLEEIYQEFRIISGCTDFQSYELQGQRQSLFHLQTEKEWLFKAFNSYQVQLAAKKSIHAAFYPLKASELYSLIVVDESQDLSHRQLELLSGLAINKQICFCEDNRQSLSDNKSKIPFLKELITHSWNHKSFNHITLSASYRCPEAIINMANAVLDLKSLATGDGQSNIVVPKEQTGKGTVTWREQLTDLEYSEIKQAASSPDFAIITLEKDKGIAKKLFNTDLVFTVDEIKGLEYKHIMAYNLFDDLLFKDADRIINDKSPEHLKNTGNRAKKDQGQEQFGPIFNSVFTAFTRATDNLTIYQENHLNLPNIKEKLLAALPQTNKEPLNNPSSVLPTTSTSTTSTTTTTPVLSSKNIEEQWFSQVKIQLDRGDEVRAKTIYIKKLNKTAAEFEQFKKDYLQPTDSNTMEKQNKPITELEPLKKEYSPPKDTPNLEKASKKQPLIKPGTSVHPATKNTPKLNSASSPVSHKSRQKNTVIESKELKAIKDLLLNESITEKHFKKLFANHDAKVCLFDTPLDNGECLFRTLFREERSLETFFSFFSKNHKYLSAITTETLCQKFYSPDDFPPLYYLLSNFNGQKLLRKLYEKNKKLVPEDTFYSMGFTAARMGDKPLIAELIKYKLNLDQRDEMGDTMLIKAAKRGRLLFIEELIKHKVQLDSLDNQGHTAVSIAADRGYFDVVEILAKNKADLDKPDFSGDTPACYAAYKGHGHIIELLAQYKANLDKPNDVGGTPASLAASENRPSVIEALAKHKANLDTANNKGATPACIAAIKGHSDIIEKLAQYNVNLNAPNALHSNYTLAHFAAYHDYANVITALGKNKANLDEHDSYIYGDTPAHLATRLGHANALEELGKYGADLNKANTLDMTPAWYAATNNNPHLIKILVKYNANLNVLHSGMTPAWGAAASGNILVIKELAQYGADLNIPDDKGDAPIMMAAGQGRSDIIELLANSNAKLDVYNVDNISPAFMAARSGCISAVEKLIELKVDFSLPCTNTEQYWKQSDFFKKRECYERMNQFILNYQKTSEHIDAPIPLTPYDVAYIMGHEKIMDLLLPFKKADNKPNDTIGLSRNSFFATDLQAEKVQSIAPISMDLS